MCACLVRAVPCCAVLCALQVKQEQQQDGEQTAEQKERELVSTKA
jgi:hypothetical protein